MGDRRLTRVGSPPWVIRIVGLGKYFGAPMIADEETSRGAWLRLRSIFGFRPSPTEGDVRSTVVVGGYALRDVTLDIEQGSVVCLSGSSDSGKSTLLKILAGVIAPTEGRVEMRGRVSTLVDVGGHLDPRLNAIENIENYARFARFPVTPGFADDVVGFAELSGFEHAPVRTYSKGMTLRLSVALALSGNPAILLLDDVLGVGDLAFQRKCVEQLHVLKERGCTLVAALSDETLVEQLATRVITLSNGRVAEDASPKHWLMQHASTPAQLEWDVSSNLPEDDIMALRSISVVDRRAGDETYLDLTHDFEAQAAPVRCRPSVFLMRGRKVVFRSLYPHSIEIDAPRAFSLTVSIPAHVLADGDYRITSSMFTAHRKVNYSLKADVVALRVRRDAAPGDPQESGPMMALALPWEIERVTQGKA